MISHERLPQVPGIIWDYAQTDGLVRRRLIPAFESQNATYTQGELSGHSYPEFWELRHPVYPDELYQLFVYNQNSYPSCENEISRVHFVNIHRHRFGTAYFDEVHSGVTLEVIYNSQFMRYGVTAVTHQHEEHALRALQDPQAIQELIESMLVDLSTWSK